MIIINWLDDLQFLLCVSLIFAVLFVLIAWVLVENIDND